MASKKKSQNLYVSAQAIADQYSKHQAELEAQSKAKSNDNRFAIIASAGAVLIALGLQFVYFQFGPGHVPTAATPQASASTTPSPNSAAVPAVSIAEDRLWNGTITVGGKKLSVLLDGKHAPQATANFIDLANKGFYNNVSCHRLTTSGIFVLQCGDPKGDGTGGPGYNFGPVENAPADNVYKTGALAMARRGGDGSSMGSQFFIVYKDSTIPSDAAGGYTVFGSITKGLNLLDPTIKAGTADGSGDGKPKVETVLGAISLK